MLPRSSAVRSNCGFVAIVSFISKSPLCRNGAFRRMILPTGGFGPWVGGSGIMAAEAGLAMGWDEWARCDGVALAELVRGKQVSAPQVAAQAAAAVARLN